MSRAKSVKLSLPLIALVSSVACATTDAAPQLTAEEQTYQDAIEQALKPATPEDIARAERSDPITRANFWSNEYQKDASDIDVTVNFMRALRLIGSHDKVVELASSAFPIHPDSYELYLELGRSYLAQDKLTEAAQAFVRSADYSPPNEAAPLAALGLAFDKLENHKQAQEAYSLALQRDPERSSTLSNYGLSLALTGQLVEAETVLRRAVAIPGVDGRIRQNLALILGLQGRFDEMIEVDPTAPMQSVEANQRVLREMMAPTGDFTQMQKLDQVIDEVNRTPAAPQSMPEIREALVNSETMADPGVTLSEPNLAGDTGSTQPTGLRPKLRGSQGR